MRETLKGSAAPVAALLLGIALGATMLIGSTMLLYIAPQFLRTAGYLVGLILGSVAFGVWSGSSGPVRFGRRWVFVLFAFLSGGVYATLWTTQPYLRTLGIGGVLAVYFLLAQPAYASGVLLAAFGRASTAVWTLFGAAAGMVITPTLLLQRYDGDVIFLLMAGQLLVARIWHQIALGSTSSDARAPMNGKTILITGVGDAGQLGYAIAQTFATNGARVVVVGHSGDIVQLAGQLASDNGKVLGLQADLTDAEQVDTLFNTVHEQAGRLHGVINVAGGLRVIRPLAETEPDEWRREIERNSDTAFLVSRAALPMLRETGGSIVNFASPAGERAMAGIGAYSAAKAAVIALTRAMAIEEKQYGVRVNAIAPGMIDTEQNRNAVEDPTAVKWVTREQVAQVVLFLCSDAASGVTGETVHVLGEGIR